MGLTSSKEQRVVVIDDSRVMQAMVENAFAIRNAFTVVGVAGDAKTGADMVRRLRPDIVTIDLCMPYLDGAVLLEMIGDVANTCKIVVSDQAIKSVVMSGKLKALGATLCIGKSELVDDPDSFFRKINAACVRAETLARTRNHPGATAMPSSASTQIRADRAATFGFPIPFDEQGRLVLLRRKNLANAVRERHFDLITRHVAEVLSFPVCLLTFIDRDTQWIKSAYGFDATDMPRDEAFCAYTIAQSGPLVVENATTDTRFKQKSAVVGDPHIRTYAGHPLTAGDGTRFGALCVLDTRPRTVSRQVLRHLAGVANIVAEIIEHRPAIAA